MSQQGAEGDGVRNPDNPLQIYMRWYYSSETFHSTIYLMDKFDCYWQLNTAYAQEIGRSGRDGLLPYTSTSLTSLPTMNTWMMQCDNIAYWILAEGNISQDTLALTLLEKTSIIAATTVANYALVQNVTNQSQISIPAKQELSMWGKKPVSKIRLHTARSMLTSYFAAKNSLVTEICIPSLSTGLSDKLIEVITKDINTYTDVSLLKENFPDIDMTFATNISAILSKVMSLDLSSWNSSLHCATSLLLHPWAER